MPVKKPKVFISYAHENADVASRLFHDLKAASIEPWLDKECLLPGQRWSDAITEAIQTSDYFLALFSSASVSKRGYVQKELKEALAVLDEIPAGSIYVLPVRLDECEIPDKKFREYQWVDLFPVFDQGFAKILRVISPPPATLSAEDEADLSQAGWGVIFPLEADPAIREALAPLLQLRQEQATQRNEALYQEFAQEKGYRPGQTYLDFLEKNSMGPGIPNPFRVPTYLLIVGDPQAIPFEFQYGLGIQYCVGRIHFDDVEDYRRYATNIVAIEKQRSHRQGRITLFGPRHSGDPASEVVNKNLLSPLWEALTKRFPSWEKGYLEGQRASKQELLSLLNGSHTPDLVFIASHGMMFPAGHEKQMSAQGSILCADWPGSGAITQDHYYSREDVEHGVNLHGTVLFCSASFSAGTPALDEFVFVGPWGEREPHAASSKSFVSPLAKCLLGRAGASAFLGQVDRPFTNLFLWGAVSQIQYFEKAISTILYGKPVGMAHRYFSTRYAELASHALEHIRPSTRKASARSIPMWPETSAIWRSCFWPRTGLPRPSR